jgi:hypothetical protein
MEPDREPEGKKPPPKCKAILLCDQVILDAMTGKYSVIGVFDRFNLPAFPGPPLTIFSFVQLVDGIGRYNLTAEFHYLPHLDVREGAVIARLENPFEFPERTNRVNLVIAFAGLILPHPGVYDFVIFADGQEIDRQRFEAVLIGANPDGQAAPDDTDNDGE